MNPRLLLSIILAFTLTGCVTPVVDDQVHTARILELQESLAALESNLTTTIEGACESNTEALVQSLHQDLRKKLASAEKSTRLAKKKAKEVEQQCKASTAEKIIFGEVERVLFEDEEMSLDARVDTGAETSSLGIYQLTEFERDGKKWVRFKLKKTKKAPFHEYRIRDDVKIKQRRQDGVEQRFEVKMDIKVGKKRYRRQVFNLADRSHLDYQVLLGRSFLKDIAIVDVSLKKQLSKKK